MNCSLPGVVSRADCQGATFHLHDMIETGGWDGGGHCLRQRPTWDTPARSGKSICFLSEKEFVSSVSGTVMDKGRRMEYIDRLKNKM